jgi:hypothetical protein
MVTAWSIIARTLAPPRAMDYVSAMENRWQLINSPDRIVADVPIWKCYGFKFKEAFRIRLPFYDNADLVKIVFEEDEFYGINSPDHTFWLNGTARPIRIANRALGLKLTEQNVTQYLGMFCGYIGFHTEAVVDGVSRSMNGYRVKAIMAYEADLYCVEMSVSPEGSVIMVDYKPTKRKRDYSKGLALAFSYVAVDRQKEELRKCGK